MSNWHRKYSKTDYCKSILTITKPDIREATGSVDGDVLYSSEGSTQGDPLAMPMYPFATIPLIRKLHSFKDDVSQVWYAVRG